MVGGSPGTPVSSTTKIGRHDIAKTKTKPNHYYRLKLYNLMLVLTQTMQADFIILFYFL
jgi:hypothetical protein